MGVLKSVSLEQWGRGKGSRASIRFRNRSHPTRSRYYLSALARATPHANGRNAAAQGHLHLDGWHIPSPWGTHELRVKQSVGNGAKRLVCIQEALPSFGFACSLWIWGWHPCPGWTLCFSAHTRLRSGCGPRPGCCLKARLGKDLLGGLVQGSAGLFPESSRTEGLASRLWAAGGWRQPSVPRHGRVSYTPRRPWREPTGETEAAVFCNQNTEVTSITLVAFCS